MDLKELEIYYFCTPEIDALRTKYYKELKALVGADEFFNNENLTDEFRLAKCYQMESKIGNHIYQTDNMLYEFQSAYHTFDKHILGEIVLQSLVADEAIKQQDNFNIFLDKRSVLYFEGMYPSSIEVYKSRRSGTLLEYVDFIDRLSIYGVPHKA